MSDVQEKLRELTKMPSAKMIALVAQKAGRDPLTALGIPEELTWMPEVAALIHEIMTPKKPGQRSEAEYDEEAAKIAARQDLGESWEQATRTGYVGPRGQFAPILPQLVEPEPAPMTPCVFPPAPPVTVNA